MSSQLRRSRRRVGNRKDVRDAIDEIEINNTEDFNEDAASLEYQWVPRKSLSARDNREVADYFTDRMKDEAGGPFT